MERRTAFEYPIGIIVQVAKGCYKYNEQYGFVVVALNFHYRAVFNWLKTVEYLYDPEFYPPK